MLKMRMTALFLLLSGTVAALADFPPPPADFKLPPPPVFSRRKGWIEEPLPVDAKTLEFVIDAKKEGRAVLHAEVVEQTEFNATLQLKKGLNTVRLQTKDFVETRPYELDWKFVHAAKFYMDARQGVIKSFRVVERETPAALWYDVPLREGVSRTFGGQLWREGLSATGLGRFPNSQRADVLNETVFGNSFQILLTGPVRAAFPLLPVTEAGVPLKEKVSIDFLKRVVTRTAPDGKKVVVTASNAGPGFLVESDFSLEFYPAGKILYQHVQGYVGEDDSAYRRTPVYARRASVAPAFRCLGFLLPGRRQMVKPEALKSVDFSKLPEPWIVMVWEVPADLRRKSFWHDRAFALLVTGDGTLTRENGVFRLSPGTHGFSSLFNAATTAAGEPDLPKIARRAAVLMRQLRTYPVAMQEFYRFDETKLHLKNVFRYRKWGAKRFQSPAYAPIPPVMAANAQYARCFHFPRAVDPAGYPTCHGPYTWVAGDTLDYAIDRLSADHSLMPAVPESDAECAAAQFVLKRCPFPCAGRPYKVHRECLGMGYGDQRFMMISDLLAWGSFDAALRQQILDYLKLGIDRASMPHLWIKRSEKFTGTPYLTNGWPLKIGRERYLQGDCNTAVGVMAYGIYLYAKYSGNWAYARGKYPFLKSIYGYMELSNAWDNPGTSGRDYMHLTEIDMDTIGLMGLCALEKIAGQLGDRDFAERVSYVRHKSMSSVIAKVAFPQWLFARDPGRYRRSYCFGFNCNIVSLKEYDLKQIPPGGMDSATQQTWSNWWGTQPELPNLLVKAIGKETVRRYEYDHLPSLFAHFNHIPATAKLDYCDYVYNSIEVRLQLGDAERVERDFDRWLALMFQPGPIPYRTPSWPNTAPRYWAYHASYVGEISRVRAAKYGFRLQDWEPAVIEEFRLAPETGTVTLALVSPVGFTLRFRSEKTPLATGVTARGGGLYEMTLPAGRTRLAIRLKK